MNRTFTKIFCLAVLCLSALYTMGQNYKRAADVRLTFSVSNQPFKRVYDLVCKKAHVDKYFAREDLKNTRRVTMEVYNMPLDSVLLLLCYNQPVEAKLIDNTICLREKKGIPTIKLYVQDEKGDALAGVTVKETSLNQLRFTNDLGYVGLYIPDGYSWIELSTIGYLSLVLQVKQDTVIRLKREGGNLDAVFSVGYGKSNRRLWAGNAEPVRITRTGFVPDLRSVADQGVPGLRTAQLTGPSQGRYDREIRGTVGIGELEGNVDEPLVVFNGIVFYQGSMNRFFISSVVGDPTADGPGLDGLSGISRDYIDSVVVLKDAVGTGIYGARGANGVIEVTTIKGSEDPLRVNLHTNVGCNGVMRMPELMNTTSLINMLGTASLRDGIDTAGSYFNRLDPTVNNNWAKWMFDRPAYNSNTSLTVSTGKKGVNLLTGGVYSSIEYTLPVTTRQSWGTIYSAIVYQPDSSRWHFSSHLFYSNGRTVGPLINPYAAIFLDPMISSLITNTKELVFEERGVVFTNPLGLLKHSYRNRINRWWGSSRMTYKITRYLTASLNLGWTRQGIQETGLITLAGQPRISGSIGAFSVAESMQSGYTVEPQFDYMFLIREVNLKLKLVGGLSIQWHDSKFGKLDSFGFLNDQSLKDAAMSYEPLMNAKKMDYRFNSAFTRLGIVGPSHLSADMVLRHDGLQRYSRRPLRKLFGAGGIAWRFSEARFMRGQERWLSFGKLNASYGVTGSDYAGSDSTAVLRWALTRKLEGALDIRLFDVLDFKASYYCNTGYHQYLRVPVASGGNVVINSAAVVRNTGWELQALFEKWLSKKTMLSVGVNVTFPRNKLLRMEESEPYRSMLIVGESINSRKVYQYLDVDSNYRYRFKDVNGDDTITSADAVLPRSLEDKAYGNVRVNFASGRFSVFIDIAGKIRSAFDPIYFNFAQRHPPGNNTPDLFNNQPAGFDLHPVLTTKPLGSRIDAEQFTNSDAMYRNGSYLLLKTVAIEFLLMRPQEAQRKSYIMKCYLQADNVALFTSYPTIGNPMLQQPVGLPVLQTLTVGVKFNFTKHRPTE